MKVTNEMIDKDILRQLIPLNALSESRFEDVLQKMEIMDIPAGKYLFREGDRDNKSVYVLEGKINIINNKRASGGVASTVEAGTDVSYYPIANQQPRALSACASTDVIVACIDSSLIDVMLTWDQSSGCEVTEIDADENDDWMTRMLQSEAFVRLPPTHIQRLLMKMEPIPVPAGTVVIEQGDVGEYFYIIQEGQCNVSRRPSTMANEVVLAQLSSGDCFGEEALVSNTTRNATVTMLTDGTLNRLAKEDFIELLKNPLVHYVDYEKAAKMVEDEAVWLDVRLPGEYANGAFDDSVNIPLLALREEVSELIFNTQYIICCDTGRRSASAAFVLSHRGFNVYVLENGLNGIPAVKQPDMCVSNPDPVQDQVPGEHPECREPGQDDQPSDLDISDPEESPDIAMAAMPLEQEEKYKEEIARLMGMHEASLQEIKSLKEENNELEMQLLTLSAELDTKPIGDQTAIRERDNAYRRIERMQLENEALRHQLDELGNTGNWKLEEA